MRRMLRAGRRVGAGVWVIVGFGPGIVGAQTVGSTLAVGVVTEAGVGAADLPPWTALSLRASTPWGGRSAVALTSRLGSAAVVAGDSARPGRWDLGGEVRVRLRGSGLPDDREVGVVLGGGAARTRPAATAAPVVFPWGQASVSLTQPLWGVGWASEVRAGVGYEQRPVSLRGPGAPAGGVTLHLGLHLVARPWRQSRRIPPQYVPDATERPAAVTVALPALEAPTLPVAVPLAPDGGVLPRPYVVPRVVTRQEAGADRAARGPGAGRADTLFVVAEAVEAPVERTPLAPPVRAPAPDSALVAALVGAVQEPVRSERTPEGDYLTIRPIVTGDRVSPVSLQRVTAVAARFEGAGLAYRYAVIVDRAADAVGGDTAADALGLAADALAHALRGVVAPERVQVVELPTAGSHGFRLVVFAPRLVAP